MRSARILAVLALALLAAGCAQSLGGHQVSLAVVESLRSGPVPPLHVGAFVLAPGKKDTLDKGVQVRAVSVTSPDDGSFAAYLGKALETDLRAAGKFDANSALVVQGQLTDSAIDAGLSTGDAVLSARFSLLRDGKTVFEKDLSVQSNWDSSFLGAVAIPEAINQYTELYDKLVLKLVTDSDFRLAVAPAVSFDLPR